MRVEFLYREYIGRFEEKCWTVRDTSYVPRTGLWMDIDTAIGVGVLARRQTLALDGSHTTRAHADRLPDADRSAATVDSWC